jgi:hypothetical protein
LVFRFGVSEMSSRRQAAVAMLYAVGGSRDCWEPPCGHRHRCREGAQFVAEQSPTIDTRALPRRPPSPPAERASGPPSPEGRPCGYEDSGLATGAVDVVAHARGVIVVDVVKVVL